MEIILTPLQIQVDEQINVRIARLSMAAYRAANILPNGRVRRKYKPYTHPTEVSDLLALKQELYAGRAPEEIAATITGGQFQESFLKAA